MDQDDPIFDQQKDPINDEFPAENATEKTHSQKSKDMLYTVDDIPPWYLCIILGFQHYLTAVGGNIAIAVLFAKPLCLDGDNVGLGELISTIFFVSGLGTFIQTTFGVRLPIIQGGAAAFLAPSVALMAQPEWQCPYLNTTNGMENRSHLPELGSEGHRDMWKARLCLVQGSLVTAALFQVFIGYSGLLGLILKYVGPLSITPTISLIGLSVTSEIADIASTQWYIAVMTIFFVTLFSQYLGNVEVPVCTYKPKTGCEMYKIHLFKLFPILLAVITSWLICIVLTATDVLPNDKNQWGYHGRTDIKTDALYASKWFRIPYPGQWGMPIVTTAGLFGMLAGVFIAMVESVGDYYACARLSGAPPPPVFAINRGSGTEGLILVLCGLWGTGPGLTSYSENIGAIGITKVGSRRVVQVGGIITTILGCLGKFGALFVTIPEPIIGGILIISLGMVTSVGLSNLQFVDLSSTRNVFIIGVSLFFGLSFPGWIKHNLGAINTGNTTIDHLLSVLGSTSMFVGGFVGFLLDNTIPGTDEERGMLKWKSLDKDSSKNKQDDSVYKTYHLPFIEKYLELCSFTRYLPFCAQFRMSYYCSCVRKKIRQNRETIFENDVSNDVEEITSMK